MPQERTLNSDELGKKGESRFEEICADAKLICNGSQRDRTGWDFIVELPFAEPTRSQSLDKRTGPLSCHFQIKTIWDKNDRIKVRLSAAERLVKEKKPAFIYVLKVTEDLEYSEAYLIHLIDDTLSTTLKRLRHEDANGSTKLNNKYITFSASLTGKRIPPTGAALKAAIHEACGPDIGSYIERKSKLVADLGFDDPRFHGEISFCLDNEETFIDAFLGKGKIELTDFKAVENRFGIPIQQTDDGPNKGHLTIDPNPTDTCKVLFRSGTDEPAIFDCDILSTPHIFSKQIGWKILIRSRFFEISISEIKGIRNAKLDFNQINFSEKRPLSELENYTRFLRNIARGDCSIIMTPRKLNAPSTSLTISEKISPENETIASNHLKLLAAAKRIFSLLGHHDAELELEDALKNRSTIFEFEALLDGKTAELAIGVLPHSGKENELKGINGLETLIINFLSIGDALIGYSLLANLSFRETDDGYQLYGSNMRFCEICEFKILDAEFDSFVERQKAKANVQGLIVNRPVIETARRAD